MAGRAHLHDEGGDDGVRVDEAVDAQVLDAALLEDQLAGLEPRNVLGAVQQLRHNAPCTGRRIRFQSAAERFSPVTAA